MFRTSGERVIDTTSASSWISRTSMSGNGAPDAPIITSEPSAHQIMDTDIQLFGAGMQMPIRQPLLYRQLGNTQVSNLPQSGLRPVIPGIAASPRMHYATAVSSPSLVPMVPPNSTSETASQPSNLAAIAQMTSIERRTVRLVCPYEAGYTYSREEVMAAIISQGIAPESIEGLGRMEKNRIWEVLFYTESARDKIASLEVIRTSKNAAIKVFPITGNIAHIKVYWASFFVPNDAIANAIITKTQANGGNIRILKGETLSIKDSKYNVVSKNSVRSFKAEVDAKDLVPHLLTFKSPERPEPITVLVTVTGRQPMCLKCKELGHHRSNCQSDQGAGPTQDDGHKSKGKPQQEANSKSSIPSHQEQIVAERNKASVPDDQNDQRMEEGEQESKWQTVSRKGTKDKKRDRSNSTDRSSGKRQQSLYATIGETQSRRSSTAKVSARAHESDSDEFSNG